MSLNFKIFSYFSQVCQKAFGISSEDKDAHFMRKGRAGDWKNHFDEDTIAKFKEWEQKWLEGSDLKFCFEV